MFELFHGKYVLCSFIAVTDLGKFREYGHKLGLLDLGTLSANQVLFSFGVLAIQTHSSAI